MCIKTIHTKIRQASWRSASFVDFQLACTRRRGWPSCLQETSRHSRCHATSFFRTMSYTRIVDCLFTTRPPTSRTSSLLRPRAVFQAACSLVVRRCASQKQTACRESGARKKDSRRLFVPGGLDWNFGLGSESAMVSAAISQRDGSQDEYPFETNTPPSRQQNCPGNRTARPCQTLSPILRLLN